MSTPRDDFAERLAAATATPGGGAAAARTGRHASALLRMVTAISLGDPALGASARDRVQEAGRRAERLQRDFEEIEAEDVAAFEAYLAALRLPRSTPREAAARRAARAEAAARATEAPLRALRAALETLLLARDLLDLSREAPLKAESDLGVSIELAAAAFRASEMMVRVNLPETAPERRAALEGAWKEAERQLAEVYPALSAGVIDRLGAR